MKKLVITYLTPIYKILTLEKRLLVLVSGWYVKHFQDLLNKIKQANMCLKDHWILQYLNILREHFQDAQSCVCGVVGLL